MIIKKIDLYKNDHSRVIVYFEDRSYITIDARRAGELNLRPGMEISQEDLPELEADSRASAARATAARIIGRHSMSCATLLKKLCDKGFSEIEAKEALDWLCELGIMDDLQYGESIVSHYRARGMGNRRIREELRNRGISREDTDTLLQDPVDMQDEILDFIKKKVTNLPVDIKLRAKITNALVRRGHSYDAIYDAFRRFEQE